MPGPHVEKISKFKKFVWEWSMKLAVTLAVLVTLSSPVWVSSGIATVTSIGANTAAVAKITVTVQELTVLVGDMGQVFGNAEILDVGDTLTAAVNLHSDAVRFKPGQTLEITNTGDRRQMTAVVTVEGKFESDPFTLLNLSRAAGRALGARPEDKIQIAIGASK